LAQIFFKVVAWKIAAKKVLFLFLSGKKQISPLLAPTKTFQKSLLQKNLMPMALALQLS